MTFVSGVGAFADDVGNGLDGEPLGGNLDGTPTGDGSPGGDYTIDFTLDATVMDARDFAQVRPGGSLVYVSQGNAGLLIDEGDEDRIRFFAHAGQTIAAKVTFTEPVIATAEFVGLTAPLQNVLGSPLVIPPTVVGVDGFIELRLTGNATSRYTVDVLVNRPPGLLAHSLIPALCKPSKQRSASAWFLQRSISLISSSFAFV